MEPQKASEANLSDVFKAMVNVIDGLLVEPPAGMHNKNYCGDTSDTVTGYVGVQVFLFREGDRINLQVNGPEGLLRQVTAHYRTNRELSLSAPRVSVPGRRVFVVNY